MHVYLSPHYDDVCFSLGHLACRQGGTVVNLFTLGRYVAVDMTLPADDWARVAVISELRRREDQLFTEGLGLARHDLGLWEPALLGYGPFDLTSLDVEVTALSARLMPCIQSMLPIERDPRGVGLYCPMGIGGHRNHLSTLLAVRRAYDALRHRCTVFLYEDLHYASVPRVRQEGLQRATRIFAGIELSPIVLPITPGDAERKMQLIGLYASQHAHAPCIVDFTPASGIAPSPHEIVWQGSPSTGGQRSRD